MASSVLAIISDLKRNKHLIIELVRRSYADQNKGTYLGNFWNYFQPLAFIAVLYYIIAIGFKGAIGSSEEFGSYLVSGMVAWLFFSKGLAELSNLFRSYSYLIRKVDFDLRYLPVIKLLSATPSHMFLVLFAVVVAVNSGYEIGIHLLQLPYYLLCTMLLLFSLGLTVASLGVFVRDVTNIVTLIIQFGFWLTPIFWSTESLQGISKLLFQLNPAAYLVNGYRDSIYGQIWFWEKTNETLIFWLFCLAILLVGQRIYSNLRPHIAELL